MPPHSTDFPFIIVSPQCPEGQIWSKEVLLKLLEEITANHAVDTSRIYLTGLSMGGYGTWDLGLAYPEKFAAIVPICGGGQKISLLLSRRDKGPALKTLGVWAFHGGKDPVVSARGIAADGGRFEEGGDAGRETHRLSGSPARFVDGDLQQPGALRVAPRPPAQPVAESLTQRRKGEKLGLLINFGEELIKDGISRVVNGF